MNGKVVLITGGAAGIGKATAERFAAAGAKVAICDVNRELGEAVAKALGGRFDVVNVADRASVQAWVEAVHGAYGRVDVLVNNAGVTRDAQLVKMQDGQVVKQLAEADWDLVVDINLKGVFNCTQAVVPFMMQQGGGVVLNASSVVGLYGNFGQTNYVATKAGVIGMTRVWARELGKSNIRVNAVCPGFTATEMVLKMPPKVLETMTSHTPLGRAGQPRDIANAYFFLASDDASFITGAVLAVDGGLVMGT
jgi:3-oxoacyl-[acyl-carrier protein] reductase